jgi:hypothetical protein
MIIFAWKTFIIILEAILMIITLSISIASYITLQASINRFYKLKKEFILPKIYTEYPLGIAIISFLLLVISIANLIGSLTKPEAIFPSIILFILSILLTILILLIHYIGIIIFFIKLREIFNIPLLQLVATMILVPLCFNLIPGFIGMILYTIQLFQLHILSQLNQHLEYNQQISFQIYPYNVGASILGFFTMNLGIWLIVASSIKIYRIPTYNHIKCFILRSKRTEFPEGIEELLERVEYVLIEHFDISSWKTIARKHSFRILPLIFLLVIPEYRDKLIIILKRPYYRIVYNVEFKDRMNYILKLAEEKGRKAEYIGISLNEVYERWKDIFSNSSKGFIKIFFISFILGFILMLCLSRLIAINVFQLNTFIISFLIILLLSIINGIIQYSRIFMNEVNDLINFRIAEKVHELVQRENIAVLVIRNKKYAKHLAHELQKRNILHFLI